MKLLAIVAVLFLAQEVQGWKVDLCANYSLGMEDGRIKDAQLTASTIYNGLFPYLSRLRKPGGWSAATLDQNQWLQVDLKEIHMITGMAIQGSSVFDEWVTLFQIQCSMTGRPNTFFRYKGNFTGNTDKHSVVYHRFNNPYLLARALRIIPVTWNRWIALRFELMGCPQSPLIELNCTKSHMILRVPINLLPPSLKANQLHLVNSSCLSTKINLRGRQYFEFITRLDECNTTCTTSKGYIHYYNMVMQRYPRPGQVIFRIPRVRVPFTCSYRTEKNAAVIGGTALEPNISVVTLSEHGMGVFMCFLYFYKTVNYTERYSTNRPISMQLSQRVYVELKFESGDRHLRIKAEHCWATPTPQPASSPRYFLIRNGDGVDPSLIFHPRPNGKIQRFSFKVFVFLKSYLFVFIHCQVRVCKPGDPFCNPLNKRGLPSLDNPAKQRNVYRRIISHGPIRLVQNDPRPANDEPVVTLSKKSMPDVEEDDLVALRDVMKEEFTDLKR